MRMSPEVYKRNKQRVLIAKMAKQVTEGVIGNIKSHPRNNKCPYCHESTSLHALTTIVYKFESCSCKHATYKHLVEITYHETCYQHMIQENFK